MRKLRSPHDPAFTQVDADRLTTLIKALAHPIRLQVIHLLSAGDTMYADLAAAFPYIAQPTLSHHLRRMKQVGLITSTRLPKSGWDGGPAAMYRLVPDVLAQVGGLLIPSAGDS